jgi:hypothetical protein
MATVSRIYCYGEPGRFPAAEFGELLGQKFHNTDIPHYLNGEPTGTVTDPGPLDMAGPDSATAALRVEVYELAMKKMSLAELQELKKRFLKK